MYSENSNKLRNSRNITYIPRWETKHVYISPFSPQIPGKRLKKDKNEVKSSAVLENRDSFICRNFKEFWKIIK